jgi:ribosomal protein S18 acetylase RimI-like enzyme
MKIRPAQIEDTLPLARVLVDTFLASNRGIMSEVALERRRQEWTYEVSAANWEKLLREIAETGDKIQCLFVAEDDSGEIIGMAFGCPSKDANAAKTMGELDVLYVAEKSQRQGVGRALTQATASHLGRAGMTSLQICTPEANEQGRRFYDKLGGRIVGTRDDDEDGEITRLVVYEWPDISALIEMQAGK